MLRITQGMPGGGIYGLPHRHLTGRGRIYICVQANARRYKNGVVQ